MIETAEDVVSEGFVGERESHQIRRHPRIYDLQSLHSFISTSMDKNRCILFWGSDNESTSTVLSRLLIIWRDVIETITGEQDNEWIISCKTDPDVSKVKGHCCTFTGPGMAIMHDRIFYNAVKPQTWHANERQCEWTNANASAQARNCTGCWEGNARVVWGKRLCQLGICPVRASRGRKSSIEKGVDWPVVGISV
jgi:hypothetical protein